MSRPTQNRPLENLVFPDSLTDELVALRVNPDDLTDE